MEIVRKCEGCGKEFAAKTANQKYCCQECRPERAKKRPLVCVICGKPFWSSRARILTCSLECSEERKRQKSAAYQTQKRKIKQENREPILKICPICGEEFETNNRNQKYCSAECQKEYNRIRSRERAAEGYGGRAPTFTLKIKSCLTCGQIFETLNNRQKYCCPDCALEGSRKTAREYQRKKREEEGMTPRFRVRYGNNKNMREIVRIMRLCKAAGYGNSYGRFVAEGKADLAKVEEPEEKLEFIEMEE